ncbi:hypothetical protein BN946_scf184909.g77 [Trametes cinnabarina]|uniref:non-specific serine/threonine protein kinase n=1 Tax=Pycnoporus cinnabarinus TaxID=5643 RepID=A0A060SGE0_PYCCI|nr:hypothetical protein BN946_scf184909.g77 [Trametes cinnabarina]
MPSRVDAPIQDQAEEGQFDDAPEDSFPQTTDPRQGHTFIDNDKLLEWSSESEDEESEPDEFEQEEDELEAEAFQTLRAEDEDWEIAERDFTKQYNRLRQHVAVRTGTAQGVTSAINQRAAVAPLPAVNRPRPAKSTAAQADERAQHAKDKAENQLQALAKYSSRLRNLDMPYDLGVGVNRKGPSATANMKDKSDRATSEQVLDPRTRIILFKMIGRGLIYEVNGCVSTGKEVGIRCPEPIEVRENVLVMTFVGDKDGWASPRLKDADIPEAAFPELYVELLLMTRKIFIECKLVHADLSEYNILYHIDDTAASEPKSEPIRAENPSHTSTQPPAEFSAEASSPAIGTASAVEEDPARGSQFPRGHLWIIDVSQSVEHDHPHAFDFLRADLRNIEDFFSKRGVHTLGLRRSFEFITRDCLADGTQEEDVLRQWMDSAEPDGRDDGERPAEGAADKAHEDEVFMRSYIPRTLNEVYDPERDVDVLTRGEGEKLIYKDTIGIVAPEQNKGAKDDAGSVEADASAGMIGGHNEQGPKKPSAQQKKAVSFAGEKDETSEEEGCDANSDDSEEEAQSEDEDEHEGKKERKPRGHRHEDKQAKKERKKAAKEEAREKRKHKIPKAEKKRKIKATARGG